MADTELKVRITGDLTAIRNSLRGLEQQFVTLNQRGKRASDEISKSLQGAQRAVRQLATALAGALSARQLAALSDEAATLNARIRLATKGTEEFTRAQRDLFDISQRTRNGLSATIELYYRLERSTRALNLSQGTLLQLTETISKAGTISGGGPAVEMALLQFGQLLAAGDLSAAAQEINSIQEQMPRLAEAIREGLRQLGIEGPASLKKLVSEGGVQVVDILRAILNQADAIDQEFAQLPLTIGGGFTQIRNAMVQYLATSQEAGTAASTLAAGLKTISENIPLLVEGFLRLGAVVAAYVVTFKVLPGLYSMMIGLSGGLSTATMTLAAAFTAADTAAKKLMLTLRLVAGAAIAFFAGWQIGTLLREQFLEVELFGIALAAGLQKVAVRIQHYFQTAGTRVRLAMAEALNWVIDRAADAALAITDLLAKLPGTVGERFAASAAAARREVARFKVDTRGLTAEVANMDRQLAASLAEVEQGYADLADAAIAARQKAAGAATGGAADAGIPGAGGGTKDKASAFRADLELLRDSIDRALAELDRLYEAHETGLAEYFREKERLQLAAIDAAIAQARHELAIADNQEAQAKALVQIEKLQRDRAEVGPRIAREQAKAEQELARKLEDVKDQLAELQGDTTASARREIERAREELLKIFADNPEAKAAIEQLFDIKTVRARLDAIRNEVDRTIQDLRGTEELLAAQQDAGQITPTAAEQQLQAIRERSIEQLRRYREALVALAAASNNDPEVLRQLQAVDTEIARVAANLDTFGQTVQDQAVQSLTGFFKDLATGAKSFKDAFRDMVLSFIQGLAQMAAQALAQRAIFALFGAPAGGAGAGGTVAAAVSHGGGMAGFGMRRALPAAAVAGLLAAGAVPRFHDGTGGPLGLAPDERLAVLQTGERVLNREETARYQAGDRPAPGYRIVNVVDPRLAADYLESAEGERTVLNIIERNPNRVRQIIGS